MLKEEKSKTRHFYTGVVLVLMAGLTLLVLGTWWVKTGVWVQLSLVDAISLLSVSTSTAMAIWLSNSDILWFVFADSPLYVLLLVAGVSLFLGRGYISLRKRCQSVEGVGDKG